MERRGLLEQDVFHRLENKVQFIRINYKFTRFNLPASSIANLGRQVITKKDFEG